MANEKRLIYSNALLEKMEYTSPDVCADYGDGFCEHGYSTPLFRLMVSETPTVDAEEVVHGHWKEYLHSALVWWKAVEHKMAKTSSKTLSALRTLGEQTHTNRVMGNHRSVFVECPCTKCIDGCIDMPHCARCNRDNGFKHFRKKAK